MKIGAKRDGTLTAMYADLLYEAGAFPGSSPLGAGAMCIFAPYDVPNVRVDGREVVANKPRVAAYRAPGAPQAMAAEMIEGFELLIPSLGLETRLAQVGIEAAHVPMMAEDAMKQTRLLVNNPRELTYDDAAAIYSGAL